MACVGTDPTQSALTEREDALLKRQLQRKRLSLAFCVLSLIAALGLSVAWLATGRFDAPRFVIILLILVGSKNHLRIYRLSTILEKMSKQQG